MRAEPPAADLPVTAWGRNRGGSVNRLRPRRAQQAGAASARRIAAGPSRIAVDAGGAAPVAVELAGDVIGLALRLGDRFLFFSGGHRTDGLDGERFASLDAIRAAAGGPPEHSSSSA